jgi:DNA-binding response OmpR family regulator
MTDSKILVVEDDQILQDALKYNLGKEGYLVFTASDGGAAVETARKEKPDLILLDVMLPVMDGLEVCRILRKEMIVPIIMLTAKADEIDKVVGLEIGADDYVTKPFSIRELIARIRAGLRRTEAFKTTGDSPAGPEADIIIAGNLSIGLSSHNVKLGDKVVEMSHIEFELLAFLASNKGRVYSRDQLLGQIWGYEYSGNTRTVDVHIRWLRKKIERDPDQPQHIITVRGFGYKFEG